MKFGEIEVLRESREVLRSGSPVKISSRAFDLLEMLIDADGALVSNEAIMAKVWPTTIVEENNIQVQICALRKLFGRHKGLIKNVFGRGYRLERPGDASAVIAPVNPLVSTASIDLAMYKPPLYLDEFFGREALLGQLTIRVQERRPLLTVVGPAGCGKSRLALEAARRLEQHGAVRTLYLSMASGAAATDAFGHIEQLLIQTVGSTDGPSPGQHTLVLVDNCDLVAERVAEFVRAMHAAGRALSVIATSRAPLRLSMEDVVYVEPFRVDCDERDLSTAIDMFVARASDVRASTYTDDGLIPYLREMVQEVDGLPLGIEFVARQTALLGVDSVRALFERDIELPKRVIRHTGDARHESLTSALSWTWNHLPSDQQKILSHFASSGQHASLKDLSTIARTVGLSEEASFEALSGVIDSAFVFRNFEGSRAALPNAQHRSPLFARPRFERQHARRAVTQQSVKFHRCISGETGCRDLCSGDRPIHAGSMPEVLLVHRSGPFRTGALQGASPACPSCRSLSGCARPASSNGTKARLRRQFSCQRLEATHYAEWRSLSPSRFLNSMKSL